MNPAFPGRYGHQNHSVSQSRYLWTLNSYRLTIPRTRQYQIPSPFSLHLCIFALQQNLQDNNFSISSASPRIRPYTDIVSCSDFEAGRDLTLSAALEGIILCGN